MTALEQEVLEKFRQLDKDAQARVRAAINEEAPTPIIRADRQNFDYDAWFREIEELREEIRSDHGGVFPSIDVVGMLREIRDGEDDE
jgi:hypothetical protein